MTYGNFQRLSEASAYSKMKREQKENNAQKRKEILDRCIFTSIRVDGGDEQATEDLYLAVKEYNDLVDKQNENKRERITTN